ncbi:uncharacterized protein ARMOST_04337 [Armillaria ostoyae]|uniref:Uncharacterized protein n=1 Tax=Armillaria ostoyae TaxID=47428 RepID=A0A284QX32_ARMOS|nr:uncharacterized protein ARMOST_04337 [Armillaria ostoyae]
MRLSALRFNVWSHRCVLSSLSLYNLNSVTRAATQESMIWQPVYETISRKESGPLIPIFTVPNRWLFVLFLYAIKVHPLISGRAVLLQIPSKWARTRYSPSRNRRDLIEVNFQYSVATRLLGPKNIIRNDDHSIYCQLRTQMSKGGARSRHMDARPKIESLTCRTTRSGRLPHFGVGAGQGLAQGPRLTVQLVQANRTPDQVIYDCTGSSNTVQLFATRNSSTSHRTGPRADERKKGVLQVMFPLLEVVPLRGHIALGCRVV